MVDTSRDVLPEWGAGVLDDPRLDLHYTDAHAFLRENEGMYDVIIMDIADPIEAGPGYILYTQASDPRPLTFLWVSFFGSVLRGKSTDKRLI